MEVKMKSKAKTKTVVVKAYYKKVNGKKKLIKGYTYKI
jgi:hypothetical protein